MRKHTLLVVSAVLSIFGDNLIARNPAARWATLAVLPAAAIATVGYEYVYKPSLNKAEKPLGTSLNSSSITPTRSKPVQKSSAESTVPDTKISNSEWLRQQPNFREGYVGTPKVEKQPVAEPKIETTASASNDDQKPEDTTEFKEHVNKLSWKWLYGLSCVVAVMWWVNHK